MSKNEFEIGGLGKPPRYEVDPNVRPGHCPVHGDVYFVKTVTGEFVCPYDHEPPLYTNLEIHFKENRAPGRRSRREGH